MALVEEREQERLEKEQERLDRVQEKPAGRAKDLFNDAEGHKGKRGESVPEGDDGDGDGGDKDGDSSYGGGNSDDGNNN